MIRAIFLLSFVIVGVIGCSSVELQRGKDLASADVAYSVATSSLVDVTIDSMIDADSEAFLLTKLRPEALTRPEYSPEKLRDRLKTLNANLVSNATQLLLLRFRIFSHLYLQKANHTSITSRFCVHGTFQIKS